MRQQTLLSSESRGVKDLVKGLKQKSDEEQLREVGAFSLGKAAQGEHYHPPQHLKGGCRQVGVSLFFQVTSDRGRFNLVIMKNFFTKRLVKPWHGLLREAVESPCLEVFKIRVDVAFRDMVKW